MIQLSFNQAPTDSNFSFKIYRNNIEYKPFYFNGSNAIMPIHIPVSKGDNLRLVTGNTIVNNWNKSGSNGNRPVYGYFYE